MQRYIQAYSNWVIFQQLMAKDLCVLRSLCKAILDLQYNSVVCVQVYIKTQA